LFLSPSILGEAPSLAGDDCEGVSGGCLRIGVQNNLVYGRITDSPVPLAEELRDRVSRTKEQVQITDIVKVETKPELRKKSNSISIKLHSSWYHSLCTRASRPRPPIKAYLSWGKSFYVLLV